jgi:hypothetical protein
LRFFFRHLTRARRLLGVLDRSRSYAPLSLGDERHAMLGISGGFLVGSLTPTVLELSVCERHGLGVEFDAYEA